jgi:hypothetical protein
MRATCIVTTLLAIATAPLVGMDSHIVGPRALGMGGAGTAAADDQTAAYWNPGLYGFFSRTGENDERLPADPNYLGRKNWGIGLADVGAQVEMRGKLANLVEQVANVDLANFSDFGSTNPGPDDLKAAVATLSMIENFLPKRDTIVMQMNLGVMGMRFGHFGIGYRQFAEGLVSLADLDRTSIGFGTDSAVTNLAEEINNPAMTPSGWTSSYTPTLITGDAATNVLDAFNTIGAFGSDADDALSKLDYAAKQAGLSASDIAAMTASDGALIAAILASANAADSFENNTTAVFTAGYTVAEIPLTYGYAINDNVAVGGNLKLMIGRVAAAKARLVSDTSQVADLLQSAFDNAEQTVTAGLDLGIAVRNSWAQVGLTARNLNRPVLKGGLYRDADGGTFEVDDVTLDPQVALGVAVYPWETLCLTADVDLTENITTIATTTHAAVPAGVDPTLKVEYATRRVGGGVEWNVLRFLALRAGMSRDLAESESGNVYHAGLGLNFWAMRFDLAGAMSTETVTVDGTDYPRSFNAGAGLTIDF